MFRELIDVKENNLLSVDYELLSILLKDRTTNKNIIWATDNYEKLGNGYSFNDLITIEEITGVNGLVIKPRVKKDKEERNKRIKEKAEVFTPSWICNEQNNLVDNSWFEKDDVFNTSKDKTWITNTKKIKFSKDKTWQDYIKSLRMEISCGEAPYLVSRYDTVSGHTIDIENRIGLLDRKFRILNENVDDYNEWIEWSKIAMKSIYGYDWQGDNVLLARENLLYTYIDNYRYKFNKKPDLDLVKEIAEIVSWNIWQMDGLKFVIPNSCKTNKPKYVQASLFDMEEEKEEECIGCKKNKYLEHKGTYCVIMNWETNRKNKFVNLMNRGNKK